MSARSNRLYELLPVIHRRRDAEQGWPLRALLQVIAEQVDVVEADIAQLYDNWFIETCQDWVVPYIGDLLGYEPVHEAGEPGELRTPEGAQRNRILVPRRDVANTIGYRRRKGALAVLEELAYSVAGWPARAVELDQLVMQAASLHGPRSAHGATVDLRAGRALDALGGPFEAMAHSIDVRRINSTHTSGRYGINNVGLFVWRLRPYSVTHTPAYCHEDAGAHCFTFSALGNDAPLFARPQPEPGPTHIAEQRNLPVPITRQDLAANLTDLYGSGASLQIWAGQPPRPIPPQAIVVADLTDWHYRPRQGQVAVDPQLGRIAFPARHYPQKGAWVSYHYGFSGELGGGEYDRRLLQPTELLLLRDADVADLGGLIHALGTPDTPLRLAVRQGLSDQTHALLDKPGAAPDSLRPALVADLNRVLSSTALLAEAVNDPTAVPQELAEQLDVELDGDEIVRFNRRLLDHIFAKLLAPSFVVYRVGEALDADPKAKTFKHLRDALAQWRDEKPRNAVIEIIDSGIYVDQINIHLASYQQLQLRAANRQRPIIRLLDWHTEQADALTVSGRTGARFVLDGVVVTGRGVHVSGKLATATLRHCTLVPGWALHHDCAPRRPAEASLFVANCRAYVHVEHSIIGSIQVTDDEVRSDPVRISLSDSIVDATSAQREAVGAPGCAVAHARLTVRRCTVIGQVQVHAVDLAENSIFDGHVTVARRQIGCMRFCYVPPESRTPRRYECQPDGAERAAADAVRRAAEEAEKADPAAALAPEDLAAQIASATALERSRVRPRFNATRYGSPAYCQLAATCAEEIVRGADDEAEMGAFHDLFQPQREANLVARLAEYTPADTDAGIIFMT